MTSADGFELLFSYGTLQLEAVQVATFGRKPLGSNVVPQRTSRCGAGMHLEIAANDEGVTRVAFVAVPHRADVDEEDIGLSQHALGVGPLLEGLQRALAEADDALVPDAVHAQVLQQHLGQITGFALGHAG